MYHQWSPYAGARPSTSSHASRWTSVTPENAMVGTAAETASTSRGCWAMWFIRAVAPERRTSWTRRLTTSTRLRSRSSPFASMARSAASRDARTSQEAPASCPSIASAACATAKSGSSSVASRRCTSAPDCSRISRSRPGVVRRRRLGRRRDRQTQRVARPGDRVVATDEAAVGEPAGERRDRVEDRGRDGQRLGPDLRNRGGLPELAASESAERPDRRLGAARGIDETSVPGPQTHAGGADPGEGARRPVGEQVVEQGVAEQPDVSARARCS